MKLYIAYKCLDFGLIQAIQHDLNLNFYRQKKNRARKKLSLQSIILGLQTLHSRGYLCRTEHTQI